MPHRLFSTLYKVGVDEGGNTTKYQLNQSGLDVGGL